MYQVCIVFAYDKRCGQLSINNKSNSIFMGNRPTKAENSKKSPISIHKRTATQSELYNFRENVDYQKSTQNNLQEFITNQNQLNAMLKSFLLQNFDSTFKNKSKRQPFTQSRHKDCDLTVELPYARQNKLDFQSLKSWVQEVSYTVCQHASKVYSRGELPYDQLGKFCVQNIFQNMSNLYENVELSSKELKELQEYLTNVALVNLSAKYHTLPFRQIAKMISSTDFALHSQLFVIQINNAEHKSFNPKEDFFRHFLDRRDLVLEHDFDFRVEISFKEIQHQSFNFTESKCYQTIIKHIKRHLAQCISNIVSISFKSLNERALLQNEAKNYVASNIALNVSLVFVKTLHAVEKCSRLKRKTDFQGLKSQLLFDLQSILANILINLADHYQQSPLTNHFSPAITDINAIDRTADERNDLLCSNGVLISKYLTICKEKEGDENEKPKVKTEDYTQFIMSVINTAIASVRSNQQDARERPLKEIFAEFSEELFMLSQNQHFRALVQLASDPQSTAQESSLSKKAISNYFKRVLETNADSLRYIENIIKLNKIETSLDGEQRSEEQLKQKKNTFFEYSESFSNLNINAEIQNKPEVQVQNPNGRLEIQTHAARLNAQRGREFERLKANKKYAFEQLIPNSVRKFTKQDQHTKNFLSKHPSLLTILTHWGQQLQDIFLNAERHVTMRAYPFKDINNQPVYLSLGQKDELLDNLNEEYKEARVKLRALKEKNTDLVGQILSKQSSAVNLLRYGSTRETSSKINAVLISLMVEYLSVLITHLLRAGQISNPKTKESCHLNLVVFGLGNLLRSKFSCDETTLTTMLKTLSVLDECDALQNKFRLVRITNNLDQLESKVKVNYLLMDRVQSQLEIVLQQPTERESNYLCFQRFVRGLAEAKFGVVSKCAEVIAQYDPNVVSCEQLYYSEKKVQEHIKSKVQRQEQQLPIMDSHQSRLSSLRQTFECQACDRLIINQNTQLFATQQKRCIKCQLERDSCIQRISYKKIKKPLLQNLQKDSIKRVNNYAELKITNQNFIPLLTIDNNGKISLIIAVFARSQLNTFLLELTHKTFKQTTENAINFNELQYLNITNQIKQKAQIRETLIFEIKKTEDLTREVVQMLGFNYKEFVEQIFFNATQLASRFQSFRKEKTLIKSIKFKTEIINCDNDIEKWNIFTKLLQTYSKGNAKKNDLAKLKYQKLSHLQFDRIKFIQANNCNILSVPEEIRCCANVQEFICKNNQVKDCLSLKLKKLKVLNLQHNLIEKTFFSADLKELKYLDLTYNQLETTDGLASLTNLKQLNLSSNQLHRVEGISSLTSLTKLHLKENQLQDVEGLASLTNLTYLELSSNKLRDVSSLANLVNLQNLYLGWNELKDVNGLSNLTNLKVLDLNLNELSDVDGISTLVKMKELYLSSNQLKDVSGISSLVTLTKLVLSSNQLQNLDFLAKTANLQFLSVNENKLKSNLSFKKLYKLREISVQDNEELKITELPVSLQKLYADFSAIKGIDFKHMINLKEINVKGPKTMELTNLPQNVQIKKVV